MSQFILEFKNALSPDFCQQIINQFENDANKHPGRTGNGVDISKKNSLDLTINHHQSWQPIQNALSQTLLKALVQYVRMHPMLLTGALSTSFQDPHTGEVKTLSHEHVNTLSDEQISQIASRIYELDILNIQKYQKQQGGYPHWHSEHFPHPTDTTQRSLRRSLLILFYLNDIADGGETEFFYQQAKVKPATGSLILAPCDFTHTHRGLTPISNDKYVIASWVMFREAKFLYE
ncbi:2OG-Fe(II) oxygenase family protein [Psychrosphaera aestuarii]|uniref:2OG-Fe(II) oxygenase family protein n=1 Tax=Psychrosphaera aestuarii TaxID=1266052 RepID=UPI001B33C93F|nr:2OG-Fe(II) oxygenase [Psychrosphaera aestuarii]